MPITSKQLEKRLVIAAKARRDIRKTTLALITLGENINKIRRARSTESNKKIKD